jgi:protein TonB
MIGGEGTWAEDGMGRGELFASVGTPARGASSFGGAAPTSLLLHATALALVLLVAPLWSTVREPKAARDYVGILTYDPPPPPAAPLLVGNGPVTRAVAQPRVRPEPVATFVTPAEVDAPVRSVTDTVPEVLPGGSPNGTDQGLVDGEEWGRDGGVPGGVPDGVKDGVVTGTGTGPVPVADYDRPPQRLRLVEPVYPPDAFAKKIEGVVWLEILIGTDGLVVRATVTRSVPQLDAAAIAAARQWQFKPATKNGRPVPSLATAPVRFTIY